MSGGTDHGGESDAALTLHDVTKVYDGNVYAVDGVDLAVREREFLTILGPSGSGKTTTLKLIAGFTSLTSGVIEIGGRDVSGTPSHKRNLGMVFQNYALFPHLTVDENLSFPLEMRRVDRGDIRRRVGGSPRSGATFGPGDSATRGNCLAVSSKEWRSLVRSSIGPVCF